MMDEVTIKFGTDGWRGVIAEDYTFANVRRCAQGFAAHILNKGQAGGTVVVGHDKRFASEHFAAAAALWSASRPGGILARRSIRRRLRAIDCLQPQEEPTGAR